MSETRCEVHMVRTKGGLCHYCEADKEVDQHFAASGSQPQQDAPDGLQWQMLRDNSTGLVYVDLRDYRRAEAGKWTICPECDRPKSLLSNGPVEYVYVCEFCQMLEENERLQSALTQAREALKEADSTLCQCRYPPEGGPRVADCNCDIHAAHRILRAALAATKEP